MIILCCVTLVCKDSFKGVSIFLYWQPLSRVYERKKGKHLSKITLPWKRFRKHLYSCLLASAGDTYMWYTYAHKIKKLKYDCMHYNAKIKKYYGTFVYPSSLRYCVYPYEKQLLNFGNFIVVRFF